MAEDTEIEITAEGEIADTSEQKARAMGWVPKEEWKGPEGKWRPADEFLSRGEEVMPILKANNRRLHGQLTAQQQETAALRQQLAEQGEVLKTLKESNAEIVKERKQGQVTELTEQIATAREANDVALESRLQAKLTNLTRDLDEEEEEEPKIKLVQPPPDPRAYLQSEWWQTWQEENPWYGEDKDRTELADFVSVRMRQNPANQGLKEGAFMNKVTAEVARLMGARGTSRSRVEGGGSRNGSGGGGDVEGYSDLPPAAKEQCAKQMKKLVGTKPGQFKDEKSYKEYYTKMYFGRES